MNAFELGVSLATIAVELNEEIFDLVENAGLQNLEIRHYNREHYQRNRPFLKKFSKTRPWTVHAHFGGNVDIASFEKKTREAGLESLQEALNVAVDLGAGILVVHASVEPLAPQNREQHKKFAREGLAFIAEKCAGKGMRLAVEFLPRTCLGNTAGELMELIDGLPEDAAGICLDTNHMMDQYRELPRIVDSLGSRLIATHLSDYDGVDEKHWIPGAGVIDWQAFFNALKNAGYRGTLNYEVVFKDCPPAERIALIKDSHRKLFRPS
ncbi:MAG: sugar phosphate isomerase/epimerase [Verrucomicrobiae bacterium]|nr:sugar phosphate isomerase/epimerase [Verrucomicrobiae bacterium]